MLTNLIDDDALVYVESLNAETRGNYELLRADLIEHYDSGIPITAK